MQEKSILKYPRKAYNLVVLISKKITNKTFDLYNYTLATISDKPLIHVIGDSHSWSFRNKKDFIVHHIEMPTMHNLIKENSTSQSNKKLFKFLNRINKERDIALLVFGEIDCRIHIYYQYEKQNKKFSIEELIDKTISNYGRVLEKIRLMGIKFYVYGIPAATVQNNRYNYPFYGGPEIRSLIYKKFNDQLKKFCEKNKYDYIDIYSEVCDKEGFISKEYATEDGIHINGEIANFVRKEINKQKCLKKIHY